MYLIFYSSRPTSSDDMKFLSVANSIMEITLKSKFLFMTSKDEIVTLYSVFKVLLDLGPFQDKLCHATHELNYFILGESQKSESCAKTLSSSLFTVVEKFRSSFLKGSMFWQEKLLGKISLSPQVKRCAVIPHKHGICELPNDLRLRIFGNQEISGKCINSAI